MAYEITITGEFQGTAAEKLYKEGIIKRQIKHFLLELEGVATAHVDLDVGGDVNLLHQADVGASFHQHHRDKITANNAELD